MTSWEIRINQSSTAYVFIGVATSQADLHTFLGGCGSGWGFIGEQALYHNREKVKIYGESFSSGDVIGVTLDLNAGTLSFTKNKKNLGVAFDKVGIKYYEAIFNFLQFPFVAALWRAVSCSCLLQYRPRD